MQQAKATMRRKEAVLQMCKSWGPGDLRVPAVLTGQDKEAQGGQGKGARAGQQ